jgi:GNAT superfamily N-acetyltransferase
MEHEWRRGAYTISTDRGRLDFGLLHSFLTTSYWSPDITREAVERAASHALVFGLYCVREEGNEQQVGYARVLTDYVILAYILDVFVLEEHRGQGLARWLMETILAHDDFRDVRTWLLKTRDARGLYEKLGFAPPADLDRFLRRSGPNDHPTQRANFGV